MLKTVSAAMSSSASTTPFCWTEWQNPSAAYRSEGEQWSQDYQLIPVGMAEPPVLES